MAGARKPVKGPAVKAAPVKKAAARKGPVKKAAPAVVDTPAPAQEQAAARARAQGRRFAPAQELSGHDQPPPVDEQDQVQQQEDPTAPEADQTLTADLVWRGRKMRVRMPSAEQLAVMQRLAHRFGGEENAPRSGKEVVRLMDRAISVIVTVLADGHDVAWLEDEILGGRLRLPEATDLVQEAMAAVREEAGQTGNRASRRAAARTTSVRRLQD